MISDTRWQIVQGFKFLTHAFDEELVIYHTGSGHTHLLNNIQSAVFDYLQQHPSTLAELTSHLESIFDITVDSEFLAQVEKMLLGLYRFDIVEPSER